MTTNGTLMGSASLDDVLTGTKLSDLVQGMAGNDVIAGQDGADALYGDYQNEADLDAVLSGTAGTTMEEYGATEDWAFTRTDTGHGQLTQSITTSNGTDYTLNLDLAANMAGGSAQSAVNIIWNGEIVDTVDLATGSFETYSVTITGTGAPTDLTIQTVDPIAPVGPIINTDGPIYSFDQQMNVNGQDVTVQAFAPGQANVYQVLNGSLHVFDAETGTYSSAGSKATVNVNAIGYNAEDNLIYGIASGAGTDSLGNPIASSDLVMIDADGKSYGMGSTPYRSWTGDFDDKGNLWSFQSSMNNLTVIDVDTFDANGNPVTQVFKFPNDLVKQSVYDVAYDAETQSFHGMVRANSEGQPTVMLTIDVSLVQDGGEPVFTTTPITNTLVDGDMLNGVPRITFGAAVIDAEGTFYVGGNSGDHDMNDATGNKGGIYKVVVDPATGTGILELVADAPGVGYNDGAADPTSSGLVGAPSSEESTLVRNVGLTPVVTDGFDDTINGGAGQDTIDGSIGSDQLIGDSQGDTLDGGDGNDQLYGGAGPDWISNGLKSLYDDAGVRYDQYGNILPEDDDVLSGGDGDDMLSGSAGHDVLDGGIGSDELFGGSGFDTLYGADGDDALYGGSNEDVLHGGAGADVLVGSSGQDMLSGDAGADQLKGGSGNDTLDGGTGADVLKGGTGNDVLDGGLGNDTLDGGSNDDTVNGGDGQDDIKGGSGNDILNGGADRDKLNGGSGNDVLNGGDDKDYLTGGKGDDILDGGAGRDKIVMGEGDDIATGGLGADTFAFRTSDTKGGLDQITDFDVTEDVLNFVALNLDANGADTQAWFDTNVELAQDGATIQLGDSVLTLSFDDLVASPALYDAMVF